MVYPKYKHWLWRRAEAVQKKKAKRTIRDGQVFYVIGWEERPSDDVFRNKKEYKKAIKDFYKSVIDDIE